MVLGIFKGMAGTVNELTTVHMMAKRRAYIFVLTVGTRGISVIAMEYGIK